MDLVYYKFNQINKLTFFIIQKRSIIFNTMKNYIRQSQATETSIEEEQAASLQITQKRYQPPSSLGQTVTNFQQLLESIKNTNGEQFDNSLKLMNKFFANGESSLFLNETQVHKKMMNQFIKLSRQLQKNSQAESKMLFILSLIGQMIKESPKFYFPFTRKFLLTVFQIDNESLELASYKDKVLAILAVIYNNLSMQGSLIKKLNVEKELKKVLLTNYYLINQLFTLKLFNRSIVNLASKGISFTSAQFSKHGILSTIAKFIAHNQVELFIARMKASIFQTKPINKREQLKPSLLTVRCL